MISNICNNCNRWWYFVRDCRTEVELEKKTQICPLGKTCYLAIAIRPDTTMMSGFWIICGCIQAMGCTDLTVGHEYEFVASVP